MSAAEAQKKKDSRTFLATEPLGHLMVRLAIPSIAAQLANLLYNIVDRIFIGHIPGIGTDALTGLGIALPLIMVITAFSALAGNGGGPLASMELGRRDPERAQTIVLTVETMLFAFGVVIMALLYLTMPHALPIFGASESTLPYAQAYLSVYLLGTFFVMANTGLGMLLLAQGDSKQMLIATATGAVLNVILDAAFIFGFGWGIQGAAWASVFSQGVSATLVVTFLRRPDSPLRFQWKLVRPEGALVRKICSVGSGRWFIVITEGVLFVALNSVLQQYGGDAYVGAMTIVASINTLAFTPINGFTQGCQPIVSYCYGARAIPRVRAAGLRIVLVSFALSALIVGSAVAFPHAFAQLFSNDAEFVELAAHYVPIALFGMIPFGIQLGLQSIFMALGKGIYSLVVATVRKLVLFIPLAFILPMFMGVDGVFWAQPISDLGSICFCSTLFALVVPKMLRNAELEAEQKDFSAMPSNSDMVADKQN